MNLENENKCSEYEQNLRAVTSASNPVEPLALMDCGEFSLLISSNDIVTLMSAQKLMATSVVHACGAIEFEQNIIPVFAFTKALQLQPKLPAAQMTLVIIQHQFYLFALCCTALEKIGFAQLHFHSVPSSMSSRKQPFARFAVVNKRAVGLTSGADLWRLLRMRNAAQTIPLIKNSVRIQGAG